MSYEVLPWILLQGDHFSCMAHHILLVEDNELNQDMLTRRLERCGFQISHAVDGQQAINQAKALRPDLILMDINIPVLDGYDATRALRSDPATAKIPIVALTAHALPEDEQRAREVGMNDYATKPIDFPALIDKINALLVGAA